MLEKAACLEDSERRPPPPNRFQLCSYIQASCFGELESRVPPHDTVNIYECCFKSNISALQTRNSSGMCASHRMGGAVYIKEQEKERLPASVRRGARDPDPEEKEKRHKLLDEHLETPNIQRETITHDKYGCTDRILISDRGIRHTQIVNMGGGSPSNSCY